MNLQSLLGRVRTGEFTCSDAVQLLADQVTKDEDSHAQLHLYDWIPADATKIKTAGNAGHAAIWQDGEMHLRPKASQPLPTCTAATIALLAQDPAYQNAIFVDETRLPLNDKYRRRTGLGEIAAVPAVTTTDRFLMQKPAGGKGKPNLLPFADATNKVQTAPGVWEDVTAVGNLIVDNKTGKVKIQEQERIIVAQKPKVPASPPHSMFEDSETMAMLLAAALGSAGGILLLETLLKRARAGKTGNLALYSTSAVGRVRDHMQLVSRKQKPTSAAAKRPLGYLERKADTAPGDPHTILDSATRTVAALNHVVVVGNVRDRDGKPTDFKLTTFYPTSEAIAKATGVAMATGNDLVEIQPSDGAQPTLFKEVPRNMNADRPLRW